MNSSSVKRVSNFKEHNHFDISMISSSHQTKEDKEILDQSLNESMLMLLQSNRSNLPKVDDLARQSSRDSFIGSMFGLINTPKGQNHYVMSPTQDSHRSHFNRSASNDFSTESKLQH